MCKIFCYILRTPTSCIDVLEELLHILDYHPPVGTTLITLKTTCLKLPQSLKCDVSVSASECMDAIQGLKRDIAVHRFMLQQATKPRTSKAEVRKNYAHIQVA